MTKNQRDYLADLAGQKGIRLSGMEEWSTARASEEIERLKAMPDAVFDEVTEEQLKIVENEVHFIIGELNKWGFSRGRV